MNIEWDREPGRSGEFADVWIANNLRYELLAQHNCATVREFDNGALSEFSLNTRIKDEFHAKLWCIGTMKQRLTQKAINVKRA